MSPPPSRWQQLYSSTNNHVEQSDEIEEDNADYDRIQNDLQTALNINDEDDTIHRWIESIQSTEDTIARLKMQEIDPFKMVPTASLVQYTDETCQNADSMLDELEAMIQEHECSISFDLDQSLSDPPAELFGSMLFGDYDSDGVDSITDGLDGEMILKAIAHRERQLVALYIRKWYVFHWDNQLRVESLIEWHKATISMRRLATYFSAWSSRSKLSRIKLDEYIHSRRLQHIERIFCLWFNLTRAELNEAKVSRDISYVVINFMITLNAECSHG